MFSSLKSKTDFDHVYEKGKIFGNRNFTLRYVKNGKDANRLGIVVSKKVSNRAVHRNRIRRQIREAYRSTENAVKQGYDLIITDKPSCLGEDYSVLSRSLNHLFYKQDLLNRNQKK